MSFSRFFKRAEDLKNMVDFAYSEKGRTVDRGLVDEIYDLAFTGRTVASIAEELEVSNSTVYRYLSPQKLERNRKWTKTHERERRLGKNPLYAFRRLFGIAERVENAVNYGYSEGREIDKQMLDQILTLLLEGKSSRYIGRQLGVNETKVERYSFLSMRKKRVRKSSKIGIRTKYDYQNLQEFLRGNPSFATEIPRDVVSGIGKQRHERLKTALERSIIKTKKAGHFNVYYVDGDEQTAEDKAKNSPYSDLSDLKTPLMVRKVGEATYRLVSKSRRIRVGIHEIHLSGGRLHPRGRKINYFKTAGTIFYTDGDDEEVASMIYNSINPDILSDSDLRTGLTRYLKTNLPLSIARLVVAKYEFRHKAAIRKRLPAKVAEDPNVLNLAKEVCGKALIEYLQKSSDRLAEYALQAETTDELLRRVRCISKNLGDVLGEAQKPKRGEKMYMFLKRVSDGIDSEENIRRVARRVYPKSYYVAFYSSFRDGYIVREGEGIRLTEKGTQKLKELKQKFEGIQLL